MVISSVVVLSIFLSERIVFLAACGCTSRGLKYRNQYLYRAVMILKSNYMRCTVRLRLSL